MSKQSEPWFILEGEDIILDWGYDLITFTIGGKFVPDEIYDYVRKLTGDKYVNKMPGKFRLTIERFVE